MKNILILYSTTDGQTQKIATYIAEQMKRQKSEAKIELMNLDLFMAQSLLLEQYDVIVLGASVRYGDHQKSVHTFINANESMLSSRQFAFFSVNLTARKPEKATPETSRYAQKLYAKIAIKPNVDAVFAGKINYPRYGFFDRQIIRLIMKITNGPTDPKVVKEFTDWEKVDNFIKEIVLL